MTTLRRVLTTLSFILAIILAVAWFFGPSIGLALRGQPFFLLPPTPERYAAVVLDEAEEYGIYGASAEFARARAVVEAAAADAEDPADLHDLLDEALVAAGGRHSAFIPFEDLAEDRAAEQAPPTVVTEGGVLVATVPGRNVHRDGQAYADVLSAGLTQPGCGAVVDLRGNTGGDIAPMLAGVSPLLDDGVVLQFVSRHGTRDVRVDGNTAAEPGGTTSTSGGKNPLPVALLIDDATASAAEAVLLSFAGLDRARSFGGPTAGYASQNIGFDMYDSAVIITTASMRDRTGREYVYGPVPPNVDTAAPEAAARDWLAAEYDCR